MGRTKQQQGLLISRSPFPTQQEQQPMAHKVILPRKTCYQVIYEAKQLDGRGIGLEYRDMAELRRIRLVGLGISVSL